MSDAARPPRFFVARGEGAAGPLLEEGHDLCLPSSEAHHAAHVLRLRAGAAVELFDGRGASATGRVANVRKGEVTVAVERIAATVPRPEPVIHLAFAAPKGSRLDWLLEKTTELGVASLVPVIFERSVAGGDELSPAKRQRWLGHCIAAAKQAGLDWLPAITGPLPLADFLASAHRPGVYGDLAEHALPLSSAIARTHAHAEESAGMPPARGLTVVVGPEGGFTDAERSSLRGAGFAPVRLGRTTLRIETAAVALVAAVVALAEPD